MGESRKHSGRRWRAELGGFEIDRGWIYFFGKAGSSSEVTEVVGKHARRVQHHITEYSRFEPFGSRFARSNIGGESGEHICKTN